jgi:hypothetical protein
MAELTTGVSLLVPSYDRFPFPPRGPYSPTPLLKQSRFPGCRRLGGYKGRVSEPVLKNRAKSRKEWTPGG